MWLLTAVSFTNLKIGGLSKLLIGSLGLTLKKTLCIVCQTNCYIKLVIFPKWRVFLFDCQKLFLVYAV